MAEYNRLPSGRYTRNVNEYVRAWTAITGPLDRMFAPLGLGCLGFDPGVLMTRERGNPVSLDTDIAMFLAHLQEEREAND